MSRQRLWIGLLSIVVVLAGCQQSATTAVPPTQIAVLPSATPPPAALPTQIIVPPTATPPPAPKASDGRTLPVVAEQVPRMTVQELKNLLTSAQRVAVIDTRSSEQYSAGHIPGALNVTESEVAARYRGQPRNTRIVIYCA